MAPPARAEQVPRIAVAGASSGVGKTLVACGVVHALREAGAGAIVAVAGMEGALATVVTSVVDVPVIGVPTSVGYGHGGGGEGALSSMLQSCALGMSVVNIDNGIGGGAAAASICRRAGRGAGEAAGAQADPGGAAGSVPGRS